MYSTEAMLSARSFGEFVSRYKYLHLLAVRDRTLVGRVQDLRDQARRSMPASSCCRRRSRTVATDKVARGKSSARAGARARSQPANTKVQAKQTADRLDRLRQTELQLTNAIASIDAERRRVESARPSAARVRAAASRRATTASSIGRSKGRWSIPMERRRRRATPRFVGTASASAPRSAPKCVRSRRAKW